MPCRTVPQSPPRPLTGLYERGTCSGCRGRSGTEVVRSDSHGAAAPRRTLPVIPVTRGRLGRRTIPVSGRRGTPASPPRGRVTHTAEGLTSNAARAAGTRRQRVGRDQLLPAVEHARAEMGRQDPVHDRRRVQGHAADPGRAGPEDPAQVHDRRLHGVLPHDRRGHPGLAGREHRAALQRRGGREVRLPRHRRHARNRREGRGARARRPRGLPDRLVRDQGPNVWVADRGCHMNPDDFPAPKEGFVITHVLIVADQDRSREFYRSLLGAQVLLERDPVIMKVGNTWLTLATGGGPTDDKPGVSLSTPRDPGCASGFLNVRVADIARVYEEWPAKGAEFLTEPKDHGHEIRAYLRDPDGHLIEVGQATGLLD